MMNTIVGVERRVEGGDESLFAAIDEGQPHQSVPALNDEEVRLLTDIHVNKNVTIEGLFGAYQSGGFLQSASAANEEPAGQNRQCFVPDSAAICFPLPTVEDGNAIQGGTTPSMNSPNGEFNRGLPPQLNSPKDVGNESTISNPIPDDVYQKLWQFNNMSVSLMDNCSKSLDTVNEDSSKVNESDGSDSGHGPFGLTMQMDASPTASEAQAAQCVTDSFPRNCPEDQTSKLKKRNADHAGDSADRVVAGASGNVPSSKRQRLEHTKDDMHGSTSSQQSKKKRPSGYSPNKVVCRLFMQRTQQNNSDPTFFANVVMEAMCTYFQEDVCALNAHSSPSERINFIESMCDDSNIVVRVLYNLLRYADYLKTNEGMEAWTNRKTNFEATTFGKNIVKALENNPSAIERNQHLLSGLYDSFPCLTFLMRSCPLNVAKRRPAEKVGHKSHWKLRFYLTIVSCIEGCGKFHDRSGNNMSVPSMCYRYLIEKLGGRNYDELVENDKAVRKLLEMFEPKQPIVKQMEHDEAMDEVIEMSEI